MRYQDRSSASIQIVDVITSIPISYNQFQALRSSIPTRRIRDTIELWIPLITIAVPAKGEAVMFEASGSFAEEDKEQGCERWETGADDAEADFDTGPELWEGTGIWDQSVRKAPNIC